MAPVANGNKPVCCGLAAAVSPAAARLKQRAASTLKTKGRH